jgi:uncharacterized protein YbaP (TraB family)
MIIKRKDAKIVFVVSILCLIVTCILVTSSFSYAQKNFMWSVQSKRSTVYVLGSIHLLKQDVYPLSRTIENAFEKSDVLAVEANINDISGLDVRKLMESAFYSGDDTLEKHVSGSTLDTIKEHTERLGLPREVVYKQKPWFLGLTLESLELMKSGYDPQYGIDKYFLSKAASTKKIVELESLDYQIDLLSGLNDEEQELFLLYTLKDLKILVQEVDTLVEAWKSGAAESMELTVTKNFTNDRRFSPIYEKLIYKRNRNMASKIEGYLKTKGTYFVVVGAAHLLGDRGIIQLLRSKGYSVEQL